MAAMNLAVSKCANLVGLALVLASGMSSWAQSPTPTLGPLTVQTSSVPKGFLRRPYTFRFQAQGGATPLTWDLAGGFLPNGLELSADGTLSGTPTTKGDFSFTVRVRDNSQPALERKREFTLQIVAALVLEWSRYPQVTGQKLDCAIRLANQTGEDFDLTVIALAVAEDGRATAVGYEHFTLKGDTVNMEIPFSQTLPRGGYELNVDAVGEVAETNSIYRARLVTKDKIQIQQGP
jgi:hypothetical protein